MRLCSDGLLEERLVWTFDPEVHLAYGPVLRNTGFESGSEYEGGYDPQDVEQSNHQRCCKLLDIDRFRAYLFMYSEL